MALCDLTPDQIEEIEEYRARNGLPGLAEVAAAPKQIELGESELAKATETRSQLEDDNDNHYGVSLVLSPSEIEAPGGLWMDPGGLRAEGGRKVNLDGFGPPAVPFRLTETQSELNARGRVGGHVKERKERD